MTLEELQSEVLRKIGRNVLNFQKFELLLKAIIAGSFLRGHPSDLQRLVQTRENEISVNTMGTLVGQFMETVYNTRGPGSAPPDETSPWISISFRIDVDEYYVSERRESLARLVKARNRLIHQLLPAYDHSSIAGCEGMLKILEEQHSELMPVYEEVKSIYRTMAELRNDAISDFLTRMGAGPD